MFSNKIKALWRPAGAVEIMAHGQECFLVKLSNDADYYRALTEDPWNYGSLGAATALPLKLDFHTLHQQRAKFARVAVEIDLTRPLVTQIRLDGKWKYIEYENLSMVCFECGKVGHTTTSYPSLLPTSVAGAMVSSPEFCSPATLEEKMGFGPWMQVTRRFP
ncbi:unnamed protein product [Linum tenue]|uniref:DUF4283 domain-containing protein n=1 Tax=Linum tenue TaxID=586396 RepID=A0AAV0LJL7_9ROSI|nr:unnamed protein product [Linum tenue]